MTRSFAAIVLLASILSGCTGGTGFSPSPSTALPATKPGGSEAQVTFTMHWPSASTSAISRRTPLYVPSTAKSVSITVNGGTPQVLNAPSTTLVIDAPVGTDTFLFQTYDETGGQGHVLSETSVTQSIVSGAANTISAVLNGVIASLKLAVNPSNFPAGTPGSFPIQATAMDADGNVIVGSSNFSVPISLSIEDPANTGTLSLTSASIASPSGTADLHYDGLTLISATVIAQSGSAFAYASVTPTPTVYIIKVAGEPQWIAQQGSGGDIWFTNSNNTVVAMEATGSVIHTYTIPTASAFPEGIAYGENGSMWFAESNTSKIGQVTSAGVFTEYTTLFGDDTPQLLTDRGDETVWYTSGAAANHIGYVNEASGLQGEITLPAPTDSSFTSTIPYGIAEGPDGDLYVTENENDMIGHAANPFSGVALTPIASGSGAEQIVRGPDGNLWFTQDYLGEIGRITPNSYGVTEFQTLSPNSGPTGIAVGADGALWFTENSLNRIGRITTSGVATEYQLPSGSTYVNLQGIVGSSDGSIWFCESNNSAIGKLVE
jgi:streptogramin lyase